MNIDTDAEYETVLAAITELEESEKRGARLSSWGGSRPGAGRPPISGEKRTPRAIRLTDDELGKVKEFLKTIRGGRNNE